MATKKIETFYDKYFNIVVYEYRGCRYEVQYSKDWHCCCTPAWVQHRDAQAKIDEALDTPKTEGDAKPFDADEIYTLYGWD